jgi:serine protease Do
MKWAQRVLSAVVASTALVFITPGGAVAADLPTESLANLAAEVTPAVVSISTHRAIAPSTDRLSGQNAGWQKKKISQYGAAFFSSGFIIDPSGYVVTNSHVLGDAEDIEITLNGGKNFSAKLVGVDDKTDLALLKVDAPSPLPFVSFGDSDIVRIGDRVLAVGNPFGLGGTVTTGIVSAKGRDLHTGAFDDFLQIDAPINPGNSGGPSFNLKGEVIGINSAIASPNGGSVGIGFAIPANIARPIIAELRLHGHIARGWIGISIQEVTPDLAESLDLAQGRGALLTSIQPGGPAAVAGLRQGDVVLAFDGHQVGEGRELPRIVAGEPAGKRVSLVVWRNGSSKTVNLEVAAMKDKPRVTAIEQESRPPADSLLRGMQLSSLTDHLRRQLALRSDINGVAIVDLADSSLAARVGLQRGDIIEQVERRAVRSPDEVDRLVQRAAVAGRPAILLLVRRGSAEVYMAVKSAKPAEGTEPGDPLLYRFAQRCT